MLNLQVNRLFWSNHKVPLQVDIDYAIIWSADDVSTNADVTKEVLGMLDYVPDVTADNNTDLECLFRYAYDGLDDSKEFDERYGIEQVVIVFVAGNPKWVREDTEVCK